MPLSGLFRSPNVEELEAKRDVQGLIKMLGYQKRDHVRQAATEALRKIGAPAVEPLIIALKDRNVHEAATETLSKIGTPAVESLITALRDQEIDVRKAAAEALGKIGDTRAVEPLIAALKGKSWQVNEAATKALKSMGRPEAEQALAEYKASMSAAGAQLRAKLSPVAAQSKIGICESFWSWKLQHLLVLIIPVFLVVALNISCTESVSTGTTTTVKIYTRSFSGWGSPSTITYDGHKSELDNACYSRRKPGIVFWIFLLCTFFTVILGFNKKCPECGSYFSYRMYLRNHIEKAH